MKFVKSLFTLYTLILIVSAAGCNSKTYEKRQYILTTIRTYPSAEEKIADTIFVNRFTINPIFSAKQFTYQVSDFEFESDYYNEFYTPPAIMITENVRNWLSESELFQRVSESTGYAASPDYILEGNIISLYCDFRDKSLPMAVMDIRFFLSDNKSSKEPVVILSKNYKYSFTFENGVYVNLIRAFDSCLFEILTKLEKDMKEKIQ